METPIIIRGEPLRNLIVFKGSNCPFNICNKHIKHVFDFLNRFIPDLFVDKYTFELRANEFNYSLSISCNANEKNLQDADIIPSQWIDYFLYTTYYNTLQDNILNTLTETDRTQTYIIPKLSYLDTYIIKSSKQGKQYKYIYYNVLYKCANNIFYNPLSFRQPDDTIRHELITIIKQYCSGYNNMCFIGGEITLFAKILDYESALFYTDFESIYNDVVRNITINDITTKCKIIDYNKYKISYDINKQFADKKLCTIINTSKHGMGENIANEIARTLSSKLMVISCNRKTFLNDFEILQKGGYTIKSCFNIITNYEVSVYILE
jgi:hypothetical protein